MSIPIKLRIGIDGLPREIAKLSPEDRREMLALILTKLRDEWLGECVALLPLEVARRAPTQTRAPAEPAPAEHIEVPPLLAGYRFKL